ncbi:MULTISPECIES: hypothetical protein [Bradyrhizobium]|uniref:hypothetical protein n=1 Tax=Bradyrhizobium TaxID=374 RepID=UPI00201135CE|nr:MULTISPECIES: hypothetical protein [Bradyrhizobium]
MWKVWKTLWRTWTIDKPAAFGDFLWEVLVVQLAALLDRLTLRKIIAFIPVVILVLAYYHRIPIPPELMLVGDFLAYIDIFTVVFLLGVLSRVTTILFVIKQAAARARELAVSLLAMVQRLDVRHRREGGARNRTRPASRRRDDDEPTAIGGYAWA